MALVVDELAERPVLVTGASGFIGRHLVAGLLAHGALVRCLARNARCLYAGRHGQHGHSDVVTAPCLGDLTDPESLPAACRGIDTVFHLAGFAHAADDGSRAFAAQHWAVNAQGTFNLLDAAQRAGVRRFVFLSSVKAVADPPAYCVTEDWNAAPTSPYGQAKRAAEERALAIGLSSDMAVVNLRPALVYGPGMSGNLPRLIHAIGRGWFPPLPETGNRRSLVHVEDVVQALLLAAIHPAAVGQTYFLSDGRGYSGAELYRLIRSAFGKTPSGWQIPAGLLSGAARSLDWAHGLLDRSRPQQHKTQTMLNQLLGWACYDNQRIATALGYQPHWDLPRALPNLVASKTAT